MVEVEPWWFTSLRRGAVGFGNALRPVVRPLGIGVAVTGSALAVGYATREIEKGWVAVKDADHPPLQVVTVDPTPGQPGDEVTALFDRLTGRQAIFGQAPTSQVGPERSHEREISQAIVTAGAIALGVAALVVVLKVT